MYVCVFEKASACVCVCERICTCECECVRVAEPLKGGRGGPGGRPGDGGSAAGARPPDPRRRHGTAPRSRVKATLGLSRVPGAPSCSTVELQEETANSCVTHVHTTGSQAQASLVVKRTGFGARWLSSNPDFSANYRVSLGKLLDVAGSRFIHL